MDDFIFRQDHRSSKPLLPFDEWAHTVLEDAVYAEDICWADGIGPARLNILKDALRAAGYGEVNNDDTLV